MSLAIGLTALISLCTNTEGPKYDTERYLDIAVNGIAGNAKLVAPFAHVPAAPLAIGALARAFDADPWTTFRVAAHVGSVVFLLACFSFARSEGLSFGSSLIAMTAVGLYYGHIKWHLFLVGMVDLYAYPLFVLAFWLLFAGRYGACLALSAGGLLVKEWMVVPLLTQAAVRLHDEGWRASARWLAATAIVLAIGVAVPRLLIPVSGTLLHIDPFHNPRSLATLLTYLFNWKRDFNILFSYLAYWLPTLLLLTPERAKAVWHRLEGKRFALGVYLALVFALVLYGGHNILIFVSYMMVAELIVLGSLLDGVPRWEAAAMLLVVAAFNLIWWPSPTLAGGIPAFGAHFGGYHDLVVPRSYWRLAELVFCVISFALARRMSTVVAPSSRMRAAG